MRLFLTLGLLFLCGLFLTSVSTGRVAFANEKAVHEYVRITHDRVTVAVATGATKEQVTLAEGSLAALGWYALYGNDANAMSSARQFHAFAKNAVRNTGYAGLMDASQMFGEMLHLDRFENRKPATRSIKYQEVVLSKLRQAIAPNADVGELPRAEGMLMAHGWMTLYGNDAKSLACANLLAAAAAALWPGEAERYFQYTANGYFQMVNLGNYPVVPTSQPTPLPPIPQALPSARFVDQGDGTTLDTATGLSWLSNPSRIQLLTWAEAQAYLENAGGAWRMPNNEEWKTMVPSGRTGSGHTLFQVDWKTRFWSSTTPAHDGGAYHIGLGGNGGIDFDGRNVKRGVWPIRGGSTEEELAPEDELAPAADGPPMEEVEPDRFVAKSDGSVLDTTSGLTWMADPSRFQPMQWLTAMGTMREVRGEWRIPTNEEWATMIPSGRGAPGADVFKVDWQARYWSATESPNPTGAYHLGLWGDGGVDLDSRDALRRIWPVRGSLQNADSAAPPAVRTWQLDARLPAPKGTVGTAAVLSGNTLIVGTSWWDGPRGRVDVFSRAGPGWRLRQTFLAPDEGDSFGDSLAISGDTLVIGAPREWNTEERTRDNAERAIVGAVYVYTRNQGVWSETQRLEGPRVPVDRLRFGTGFGQSVAISGSTLCTGMPLAGWNGRTTRQTAEGTTVNDGRWAGAVHVYSQTGGTWNKQHVITGNEEKSLGRHVGLSDNTLIATQDDGPAIYERSGGTWTRKSRFPLATYRYMPGNSSGMGFTGSVLALPVANPPFDADGKGASRSIMIYGNGHGFWAHEGHVATPAPPSAEGRTQWGQFVIDGTTCFAQVSTWTKATGSNETIHIFERDAATWQDRGTLTVEPSWMNLRRQFAPAMALSQDTLALVSRQGGILIYTRR